MKKVKLLIFSNKKKKNNLTLNQQISSEKINYNKLLVLLEEEKKNDSNSNQVIEQEKQKMEQILKSLDEEKKKTEKYLQSKKKYKDILLNQAKENNRHTPLSNVPFTIPFNHDPNLDPSVQTMTPRQYPYPIFNYNPFIPFSPFQGIPFTPDQNNNTQDKSSPYQPPNFKKEK